jgi:hypothetical protein
MLISDRGYDARDLAARLIGAPGFIKDCATTHQITAIQRNYFRQIGIWMISLIRDGRFLRSPRSVIDV